jgi:hypothetical protein
MNRRLQILIVAAFAFVASGCGRDNSQEKVGNAAAPKLSLPL